MRTAPQRDSIERGFTLVEMMVVLFIMAFLVTAASVSVGTTQDKIRADKTAAIGREVVEALERTDGLSFVSDFGRLPDKNEEEVQFLFNQDIWRESETLPRSAHEYSLRTLTLPPEPTMPSVAGLEYTKIENAFGSEATETPPRPKLGAGWRGPYTRATALERNDDGPTEFLDGWKNPWRIDFETVTEFRDNEPQTGIQRIDVLRSPGRDNGNDIDVSPEVWPDEDVPIRVGRSQVTDSIELNIDVIIRDSGGDSLTTKEEFEEFTLKALYFTPRFDTYFSEDSGTINKNIGITEITSVYNGADPPEWQEIKWFPSSTERNENIGGSPFDLTISGVTAGHRMIFLYALGTPDGGSQKHFAGAPRLVQLRPGTNSIEYILTEL